MKRARVQLSLRHLLQLMNRGNSHRSETKRSLCRAPCESSNAQPSIREPLRLHCARKHRLWGLSTPLHLNPTLLQTASRTHLQRSRALRQWELRGPWGTTARPRCSPSSRLRIRVSHQFDSTRFDSHAKRPWVIILPLGKFEGGPGSAGMATCF